VHRLILTAMLLTGACFGQEARTVQVGKKDVVSISARQRNTTVIVLPDGEVVLDASCGDKERWQVNGVQGTNMVMVKPAIAGSSTNLNVITASGNLYSFLLTEGAAIPDYKVFVELKDEALLSNIKGTPKFVPASALQEYEAQMKLARNEVVQVRKEAADAIQAKTQELEESIRKERVALPSSMKFDYEYTNQPGFNIRSMYHDNRFTYIVAAPDELPSLYEIKDGKPNLVEFRYETDRYVVDKILGRGYLRMRKQTLHFDRKGS
jgi:type IV secretory pathway VirB9-like protein